ncbi:Mov34/MPN/PAD-1 family protein [Deinococcus yunweiensis]|uniref:Mov34/MPN/PAD-1 family protein n=1 Tax=Deinococcus yunweiensis TaxID=367282 RepID=UPI00398F869A
MRTLYRFRSADGRYGTTLTGDTVRTMLGAARAAGGAETGGILIGLYNGGLDTAMVTQAAPPPPDSRGTQGTFYRGVAGVGALLQRLWRQPIRTHYLGEWHVHPGTSAERSATDDNTMRGDGLRGAFGCLVPILVILGGDPQGAWELRAWAYPERGQPVVLAEQQPRAD